MPFGSRWVIGAPALALALILTGSPAVLGQDETFNRIADETAAARELPPLDDLTEVVLTSAELQQRLPEMMTEDYPAEEAAAESRSWAAFGLLPPGTDLSTLFIDLLGEQVAGYYDPETNEMFVISDGDGIGPIEEFTYAHEVVHALQDEHLDLGDIIDQMTEQSDDAALAITSLYEGDATVASTDYLVMNPMLAGRLALSAEVETPLLDEAPPVLALWLLFPYVGGQNFVNALRSNGGWEAVNAAYADPPVSSEQILHPEKYLQRDDPTPVTLPDPAAALGPDWIIVDEDDLGEFQIAVMLANLAPGEGLNLFTGQIDLPAAATNAAAGWDGDRYALWASADEEVLVWRSVWDSAAEATAFARAMQAYDQQRFGSFYEGETPEDVVMVTETQAARIKQAGAEITYVLAPSLERADAALGAVQQHA